MTHKEIVLEAVKAGHTTRSAIAGATPVPLDSVSVHLLALTRENKIARSERREKRGDNGASCFTYEYVW